MNDESETGQLPPESKRNACLMKEAAELRYELAELRHVRGTEDDLRLKACKQLCDTLLDRQQFVAMVGIDTIKFFIRLIDEARQVAREVLAEAATCSQEDPAELVELKVADSNKRLLVQAFIEAECERDELLRIPVTELYQAFVQWPAAKVLEIPESEFFTLVPYKHSRRPGEPFHYEGLTLKSRLVPDDADAQEAEFLNRIPAGSPIEQKLGVE